MVKDIPIKTELRHLVKDEVIRPTIIAMKIVAGTIIMRSEQFLINSNLAMLSPLIIRFFRCSRSRINALQQTLVARTIDRISTDIYGANFSILDLCVKASQIIYKQANSVLAANDLRTGELNLI